MEYKEIIQELESLSNSDDIEGMARFGINPQKVFGVRMPELRRIAKKASNDHGLASQLWQAGYQESMILACMIEDPKAVTEEQMDDWVLKFDTWAVCDQCCIKLFHKTPYAYKKVFEWSTREEQFVKRAAFTLIAVLAVHDKKAPDQNFEQFFPIIIRESTDNRIYVKKAVNWALRQIGKRNINLNRKSVKVSKNMLKSDSKAAQWIAKHALHELQSDKVQKLLTKKIGY
ncbi:MAG: DNA alkylation repair protein [Euryarchaeota archaeon]|jgi:3-methyladenine DNA glycosylase AlkD|uniref:DNA alkylation repair protein n=1 Tax=Methanobacterium sp. MZD130B TaxID=3394378 RepID=UPI0017787B06|nr:DNA alkylation repair protein [Euryarchaeota archaeon]HHT19060.1 DNA alkylation repair protein [Methanobacterium sp.]